MWTLKPSERVVVYCYSSLAWYGYNKDEIVTGEVSSGPAGFVRWKEEKNKGRKENISKTVYCTAMGSRGLSPSLQQPIDLKCWVICWKRRPEEKTSSLVFDTPRRRWRQHSQTSLAAEWPLGVSLWATLFDPGGCCLIRDWREFSCTSMKSLQYRTKLANMCYIDLEYHFIAI